jgi:hypothetical protein
MELGEVSNVVRSYSWKCIECKICEICQKKGDDVCSIMWFRNGILADFVIEPDIVL